jgi:general secretion pathway protein M
MTALTTLRAQALARWRTLSPREQRSISVLGALLSLVLLWSVAIAPARQTLIDSDNRRAQLGQQQAHMLALQAQAQALKARSPLSREEALRSLQSLTPGTQIQLQVQGDRVTVQLKAVPAPVLATWLAQARHQAQALPIEAHLTRATTPATTPASSAALATPVAWDGTLVLSLPNRAGTGN